MEGNAVNRRRDPRRRGARPGFLLPVAATLVVAFLGGGTLSGEVVTYRVGRAREAPSVDGRLDDACWRSACVVDTFGPLGGGQADGTPATRALLSYDADFLYVAFDCREPLSDKLEARTLEHDGPTWKDDGVEIFLNPSGDRERYVQLAINVAGTVMDGYIGRPGEKVDTSYETGAEAKAVIATGSWSLELRVPFAGLPLAGPRGAWTFHLARNRRAAGQLLTSLQSATSGFHEIAKFDRLEGIELPERPVGVVRVAPGEFLRGTNVCRVRLRNWGEERAEVTLRAGIGLGRSESEGETESEGVGVASVVLPPGEEAGAEVAWDLREQDAGTTFRLAVRLGERLLQSHAVAVPNVPALFGRVRCPVFYFSQHRFVRVELPVNLAERSRLDARLRWQAVNGGGQPVGRGLTTLRDRTAVLRLYWPRWAEGSYRLHLNLERGGEKLGRTQEAIRLVMNPWGE